MKTKLKYLKLKMLKENKLLFWKNQTLMKLKSIKHLSLQRNIKMINMDHQSPQQKQILTQLKKKINQENLVKEANTSPISAKKKIDTVNKIEKSQTSK